MKKLPFDRTKLTAYSGMAAALLATEKIDAQIAYTDITPNAILNNTEVPSYLSEMIDFNNDGIADLEIQSHLVYNSDSGTGFAIKAKALHGNRVLNTAGFFGCVCSVKANNYGYLVNSNPPQGAWWRKSGYLFSFIEPGDTWQDGGKHFIGVELRFSDSTTHYGWLRLKVMDDFPVEILDYACNIIPDEPIAAGQTLPCGDAFENNNDFSTAKPVETGHKYHALIDEATDLDFFKWNYVADTLNPNVQISIFNLPADYNLKIFNADQALIATSKNKGIKDEKIFYNGTLPGGSYLIKVYPKNSMSFDPVNCYSLKIESRSTPFPKIGTPEMPASEITSIKVFPNPAEDHITFLRTDGLIRKLRIVDVSGREVKTYNPATEEESVAIDISHLQAGTYFAQITGTNDVIVTKFIVQK